MSRLRWGPIVRPILPKRIYLFYMVLNMVLNLWVNSINIVYDVTLNQKQIEAARPHIFSILG